MQGATHHDANCVVSITLRILMPVRKGGVIDVPIKGLSSFTQVSFRIAFVVPYTEVS